MYKIMDGNEAAAYVSYNFTEVAGIYPITPSSPMANLTDRWSMEGKKNYFNNTVKIVEMQSEAGAAGMVHGALRSGALTSTYTSSQGLLLMIPNMYKISGELLPAVINVASRSIATHALSILGDHQDIYAVRQTGFAILVSSSVQQVMDLTGVAHLSAIKGSIPFVNSFDGFRTSHELSKVEIIDKEKLEKLIDKKALEKFRNKALNPNNPKTYGTNQGEDVYFQNTEIRNQYYEKIPDIVEDYMDKVSKITNREYKPFTYYGDEKAKHIIVAMGSVCETIRETVDYLNSKSSSVGLIEVHLYRPFSEKHFLKVLPKTVKKIAVLDRTKEPGSFGEPLFLDIAAVIQRNASKVKVYGGRYGLSSKNTTPAMIKGLYDFLTSRQAHHNFTLGIKDDITNLSIDYDENFILPSDNVEFIIYGFGSDGMISASKDILKITGENTNGYVQGYFKYDSRKSGGKTVSYLRFGKKTIKSTYYPTSPSVVICTKDSYLQKINMLDNIKPKGTFILNTSYDKDEVLKIIRNKDIEILRKKKIDFYIINASKIAEECNITGKISTIMELVIFKLGKLLPFDFALNKIKDNLFLNFSNSGNDLVNKNLAAIEKTINSLEKVKIPQVDLVEEILKPKTVFEKINDLEGDDLPVSTFINMPDGVMAPATSKLDKPNAGIQAPVYNKDNCIQCNMCSIVCPHAAIRPFLLDEEEEQNAPAIVLKDLSEVEMNGKKYKYVIGIDVANCTGCGLCIEVCPGRKGIKALMAKMKEDIVKDKDYLKGEYLYNNVSEKKDVFPKETVKGSQFITPKFEYSGACSGCGETPYLKLLTQMFGENMIIANSTGCSSIYGASMPSSPYNVPWANSLFEDTAEYGLGMKIADNAYKEKIVNTIKDNLDKVKKEEKDIYLNYSNNITKESSKELLKVIENTNIKELRELKDYIAPRSFWIVGGDGWAYDIGFGGLDHVISTNQNVNILVLDTETYSNTGGQSSKASRLGSVNQFSSHGKKTAKKDLIKMAMNYPHVYVGTISLSANPMQTIRVLKEAENYNGPSLILAYSPCIVHGILKGMKTSAARQKDAVKSGYFPLFHYNPETNQFKMDSKSDFSKYKEFLLEEDRYYKLTKLVDNSDELFEENLNEAKRRYESYENLTK